MGTLCFKVSAVECQVTDRCCWPDVVHRPHNGFSCIQYLANTFQRQHALINPVQMDDICLLKLWQLCDVCTTVGDIHLKQVLTVKVEPQPHDKTLPKEIELHPLLTWHCCYGQSVCLLVAHQHLRLHTIVVQRLHQPAGSYCSATRPFACIDYEYSHGAKVHKK